LNKITLSVVGIIGLFILSAVAPIGLGLDVKITSIDTTLVSSSNYPFVYPDNEVWNKTFGGTGYEIGEFIQQTSDGGYIIVGWTKSYGAGNFDIWLIKTDIDGNELWNKTLGGPNEDIGSCIRETSDNGFIITGYTSYGDSLNCVWLIKTDSDGDIIWERNFSKLNYDAFGKCVIEIDDGYVILARLFSDDIQLRTDIWLIKTDFDGNTQWIKTIGDNEGEDIGYALIETSDGDFVITGDYRLSHVLLIKTDSEGNRLWRKLYDKYEGLASHGGTDIKECDDGGYVIAGKRRICLIRTDKDGNFLWKKDYQAGSVHAPYSLIHAQDGGFILVGYAGYYVNPDVIIIKTDENGNREWEKLIGTPGEIDGGVCVILSNDNTYVLTGFTDSFSNSRDVWMIKIAPFENQRPMDINLDGPINGKIGEDNTYFVSTSEPDDEPLFYWFDWGDTTYTPWQGPYESNVNCVYSKTWYSRGTYTVSVKARDPYGGDSEWAELEVSIPRSRVAFFRYLDSFPLLKEVLLRLIR
jgi:hypothetical protein